MTLHLVASHKNKLIVTKCRVHYKFLVELNTKEFANTSTKGSYSTKIINMAENFVPKISLETPLEDYKKIYKEKMESDELIDDAVLQENNGKLTAKMREVIWSLLFAEQPPKPENLEKAGECLNQYKMDACFHSPWDYNDWIPKVRDELLKRKMFDFWRDQLVSKELGPCWARDSDYFDDIEDSPDAFYKHAGCVAPFSNEAKSEDRAESGVTIANAPERTANTQAEFVPNISLETPLEDYKELYEEKMESEELIDDEVMQENFKRMTAKMREVIWTLLFAEEPAKKENLKKASECLARYKMDACFQCPWDYNDWIPKVRDELLKREMLEFWRNEVVAKELGPCWARDSDYFDDIEDTPEAFYKHAGCVAPFSAEAKNAAEDNKTKED